MYVRDDEKHEKQHSHPEESTGKSIEPLDNFVFPLKDAVPFLQTTASLFSPGLIDLIAPFAHPLPVVRQTQMGMDAVLECTKHETDTPELQPKRPIESPQMHGIFQGHNIFDKGQRDPQEARRERQQLLVAFRLVLVECLKGIVPPFIAVVLGEEKCRRDFRRRRWRLGRGQRAGCHFCVLKSEPE